MRIAFISTILNFPWGGADTLWTNAAEAAAQRGDRLLLSVSPAVVAHPRIAALAGAGAEIFLRDPSGAPSFGARVRRKLGLAAPPDAGLIAALQSFRPDLVIFSQGGTYDLVLHPRLAAWLRATGVKYRIIANWQQEHPRLTEPELAFIREVFTAADSLNFVSTRNLAVTRRHLDRPLPNARVIQNPLRWRPADVSPWPAEPVPQLATVSRLDEGKGLQLLLAALTEAGSSLPDWRLNIYGQGPHEARLREITAQSGLGERVRFRGYVKELRAIWAENHLLVSPALEDGVPMTIPEAMLCQRPVLATRVGGAEDWIEPGRTGFLCSVPEVIPLKASLREAFAGRARWEAMGQAAAVAAASRYMGGDHLQLLA
ncbi:MAG: glycosyltransferase family 4 protein [Opitutae bacterium]|nr:glycosyltransferase family 4 protein [Opitutae bacterium]